MSHQLLSAYLYGLLLTFVTSHDLGTVLYAPLRVRLRRGKYREPDVVFMATWPWPVFPGVSRGER